MRTARAGTNVTLAHHPFDAVGWDGYLHPFTFNAQDFRPITGTVHQPPPIHQTFEIRGLRCLHLPRRACDALIEAVRIPWVRDNVEADEVLFYVRGNFGFATAASKWFDHIASTRDSAGRIPARLWRARMQHAPKNSPSCFDTHTLELTEEFERSTIRNIRKAGSNNVLNRRVHNKQFYDSTPQFRSEIDERFTRESNRCGKEPPQNRCLPRSAARCR